MLFKIEIKSHHFVVINPEPRALPCIIRFCREYGVYNWIKHGKKPVRKLVKIFAARVRDNREYRFHVGQYEEFIKALERDYILPSMYTVNRLPLYEPTKINIALKDCFKLRDYQEPIHDFMVSDSQDDLHSRLAAMQTGTGKGMVSITSACTIGYRVLVLVLPTYLEKWQQEIEEKLTIDSKDIVILQGSSNLKSAINLANDGNLNAKFIIVSLRTIQNFFKQYEEFPDDLEENGYFCHPEQFCQTLGIGTVIIDEVHQHLHAVYKFLVYTHVPKVIALSATLTSDDYFIKKMQHTMFPRETRYDNLDVNKYIKCYSVGYQFDNFQNRHIRVSEYGSNTYSHTAFEKSVMKNYKALENYVKMIDYLIRIGYIEHYQSGDKLIIFVGTIALATHLTNVLRVIYPDLDVRRYVENDPFENVIDADIRVTTVLSAGTAVDIPGLVCTIMTNNLKSSVSNLQSVGRLREIKGRDTKFYYIYCHQIPKHVEYNKHRIKLFQTVVASVKQFEYPYLL